MKKIVYISFCFFLTCNLVGCNTTSIPRGMSDTELVETGNYYADRGDFKQSIPYFKAAGLCCINQIQDKMSLYPQI